MSTVDQDRIAIEAGFRPIPAIYNEQGDIVQSEVTAFEHYSFVLYGSTHPCVECRVFAGHTVTCTVGWREA